MDEQQQGLSRREVLRGAAAAGATVAAGGVLPAEALARSRSRRSRARARQAGGKRVAVLGGGMAGLAAAHELAERGFEVLVVERKALGGKARSIPVPGTGTGGRRDLPGEHGFRFFPGFYHHVPDTMRRIPVDGNANGVWDNLVPAMETRSTRAGGRAEATLFGLLPDPGQALTVEGLRRVLVEELLKQQAVPPHELLYFVERLLVFVTSCDERRFGQWERTSWWEFVNADGRSAEYQKVVATGLTRALVAAKERIASTRTIGNMAEAFVLNFMGRGADGAPDRVLDAPTNEAWIDPWIDLLAGKHGVRFAVGHTVERLDVRDGRITGVRVRDAKGVRRTVEADWYVCALPAERARKLWSPDVLRAAPHLEAMDDLVVDWMNGIQFFLKEPVHLIRGHVTFVDAPWALTCLTQGQFWGERRFTRDYGDGTVVDCLSVDVSDWGTDGILFGKPARRCTKEEVAREVWAQMQAHLNDDGRTVLPDSALHSWFLDPGIAWVKRRGEHRNDDPLLINTVDSWDKRPTARTPIPNLLLAGDYVQTDIDLATMEGANESGREAANAILDASGSKARPAKKFRLLDPPEFAGLKALDRQRWRAGQANVLDVG
ncbi:FAD-dependent oxidoreductase [Conexibacter sp. SYSU D00693]|uniref:hydroxysqualene dehydroxylase n=1 Tax=Conexibacter sp. SYSU D00693 TaxID=2812560 RepID=UPI00196AC1B7|nr:FAD-dependent oxidoreductase [Conexibacter sp. SYSU D00693]